jgi:hypothetical protein
LTDISRRTADTWVSHTADAATTTTATTRND